MDGRRIVRFNGNKYHWLNAPGLQVAGGAELTGVAIDMPPTATVTGQITNVNAAGIGAEVRAIIVEDGVRVDLSFFGRARSDFLTGRFSLVVPATTLTLGAFGASAGDRYQSRWLGDAPDASSATVLQPAEGQVLVDNNITLSGGMTLWGVVRDTAGDPVSGVDVTALAAESAVVMGSAVTATDGTWSITGLGWGAMPGVNVRYTHDRLVSSWFPKGPTQGWATDALNYASVRPDRLMIQVVNHLPEHRLAAAGTPTIEGTPLAGLRLDAHPALVTPAPEANRYQWFCDGTSLGLTTESIQLAPETAGCQLTVRQISTLADHQPAIVDSAPVTVSAPEATARAAITGTPVSGNLLRATRPTWNFTPDRIARQWYRNGVPIRGATGTTYRLVTADVGDRISVKVSAQETSTGLSAATTAVRTRLVKARTRLRARWVGNRQHISTQLRIRVLTPGQPDPRGFISIKYYDHAYRHVVNGSSIVKTIYGNRQGWVKVRINYGGSYRATPASMTLRVYMH